MHTTSAQKIPDTISHDLPVDWLSRLRRPPPHPGEVFKTQFREPLKLSQAEAARRLGFSAYFWGQIELGRRPVSTSTAIKMQALTNMTAEFWGTLQLRHDLWHAYRDAKKRKHVIPGEPFPKQRDNDTTETK